MLSFVFGGAGIVTVLLESTSSRCSISPQPTNWFNFCSAAIRFQPQLSLLYLFITVALLALVTVIAVLYPLYVARSITPLDADAEGLILHRRDAKDAKKNENNMENKQRSTRVDVKCRRVECILFLAR